MERDELNQFCAEGASVHSSDFISSGDVRLRLYTFNPPVDGGKPPVLFIAGWISRMHGWKAILREMTADRTVYYLETREKSSSRLPGGASQSVDAIAGDIVDFIRQNRLKERQYILFGSSLGATAILEAAPDIEQKPRALVLVGPNAHFRIPPLGKFVIRIFPPSLYIFLKYVVKWYLKNYRLDFGRDRAQYEKYSAALDIADPWKLKRAALALSTYEVWERLPHIDVPVLLVNAGRDVMHEPDKIERMLTVLSRATMVDMETNSGTHSPELVAVMDEYIDSLD